MSYFDFSDDVEEALLRAGDDVARLSAKTAVHRARFPDAVKKAGFNLLSKGALFSPGSDDLVVGIAPWSDADLAALEDLAAATRRRSLRVSVYDIDDLTFAEIFNLLQGRAGFRRTPVVMRYQDGKLTYLAEGQDAVLWLRQI